MDHPLASSLIAPAPSTAVKAITRSALLEAHVGAVVGAAAAALGAALGELQDGKLTSMTKGQGGDGALSVNDIPKLRVLVRKALRARAWWEKYGPVWAQPLPISDLECIHLSWSDNLSLHLVGMYALSLQGRDYEILGHPQFFDYCRGVMAAGYARSNYLREDPALQVEFPPKEACRTGRTLSLAPAAR